jgi:TDG/mug DNA glycosylase family protein
VLHAAGFTPRRLQPADFAALLGFGIGLTDLAKHTSGVDRTLRDGDLDRMRLEATLMRWKPEALAFTSRFAAEAFLAPGTLRGFGEQQAPPGGPRLFVLPSPSGANAHWPSQRHHWHDAARALGFA